MKQLKVYLFVCSMFLLVPVCTAPAMAQDMDTHDGVITILSPKNGAVLHSGSNIKLSYNVHLSPSGNHLHIYVDDHDPIIDRDVSNCPCSMTLPHLSPGKHRVAVKEAMVNHVLTGVQAMVMFTVK